MAVDSTEWKFFEFSKIFTIEKGFYNKKPESSGFGKIPFIGASDKNHGITGYYTLEEINRASKTGDERNLPIEDKIFEPYAICVTNNGSVGYAYYMDKIFTCSHDVNPLYKKDGNFNYYTGMFVSSVIMKDRYRWGYGRKWRPTRMENSKIKLPVVMKNNIPVCDPKRTYSNDGYLPDWEFMESYIKCLNYKKPETKVSINETKKLKIDDWEEFKLSDLFDVSMGNGIDAVRLTNNYPKYNYVSRNRNNNGVVAFVDEIEGEKAFNSGDMTLALGGSYLGSCFLQDKKFYTGQNVGILKPKKGIEISRYAKLFIATVVKYECRFKYQAFGRELNAHFGKDFCLELPILKDSHEKPVIDVTHEFSIKGFIPDWHYMESFVKSLPNSDLV